MNKQQCEQVTEWMSLAQDGLLNATQSHLLHVHADECPTCKSAWDAMTAVSQLFRAAPMIEPEPGFVQRFQGRLAFREEQRRRSMIWLLLGIGVVALAVLALPSLLGLLSFTGRFVLPYPTIVYLQQVVSWLYLVAAALLDAMWLLVRYACSGPAGPLCLALMAAAGALAAVWTRFLIGRMSRQGAR